MKKQHRIAYVFTVPLLAMLLTLTSCIVIPRDKYFNTLSSENVAEIQIIDIRQSDSADRHTIPANAAVYTVSEDNKASFLLALAEFPFDDSVVISCAAVDYSTWYEDFVIKLIYTDNSYRLISATGYNEYYEKSGVSDQRNTWRCEKNGFIELIKPYLPTEVFDPDTERSA